MPFTGSFSLASSTVAFNAFVVTDTSSFVDEPVNTFDTREVTITFSDGSTDITQWPFSDGDTLLINPPYTRDYALKIQVDWISLNPQPNSVYVAIAWFVREQYNNNNEYGLINAMTGRPNIVQDRDYIRNMGKVRTEIVNSEIAIAYAEQVSSQWAINRAANLLTNQPTFF